MIILGYSVGRMTRLPQHARSLFDFTRSIDLDWGVNAAREWFVKIDSKMIFVRPDKTGPVWMCAWRDNRVRVPQHATVYPSLDDALRALGYMPR